MCAKKRTISIKILSALDHVFCCCAVHLKSFGYERFGDEFYQLLPPRAIMTLVSRWKITLSLKSLKKPQSSSYIETKMHDFFT